MVVERVTSADGTILAYESTGDGSPLVLVGAAFCGRMASASGTPLAALLVHRFTVLSYDRRGRGDSTDSPPYAIEREVEDLAALIAAAGGSAYVFGNSSGGLLALDAVVAGLPIEKLALYEPPIVLDPERSKSFEVLASKLDEAVAEGRRDDAVELYFTQVAQMLAPAVAQMRKAPMWQGLEAIAHTLSYDLRITARGAARLERLSSMRVATLVLDGGASPPWMHDAARTLAEALPGSKHQTLEGQTHAVDIQVLANALEALGDGPS
jgi:pimeloyl-ACP methyl ester carboxylesterase